VLAVVVAKVAAAAAAVVVVSVAVATDRSASRKSKGSLGSLFYFLSWGGCNVPRTRPLRCITRSKLS
jgi:hypothetical protein